MMSGFALASASASRITLGKFAIDDERPRLRVIEGEGEDRRVEARVQRIEDGARHRDAVVAFKHRRRIGEHDGNRLAARQSRLDQRAGEAPAARVKITIIAPQDRRE